MHGEVRVNEAGGGVDIEHKIKCEQNLLYILCNNIHDNTFVNTAIWILCTLPFILLNELTVVECGIHLVCSHSRTGVSLPNSI